MDYIMHCLKWKGVKTIYWLHKTTQHQTSLKPSVKSEWPCPVQTDKDIYCRLDVEVTGRVLRDQTSVRRNYEARWPVPGGHSGVTITRARGQSEGQCEEIDEQWTFLYDPLDIVSTCFCSVTDSSGGSVVSWWRWWYSRQSFYLSNLLNVVQHHPGAEDL